jgi:2',3'-cyclic-nucleotide 2'-phosphodiesterase (5'-nucleotidase family)
MRSFRRSPQKLRHYLQGMGDPVLYLDAGDWFGGALYDASTQGDSTAKVMIDPSLDLDATVVGNHAWDYNRSGLDKFAARLSHRVPILAANVLQDGAPPPWSRPWVKLNVNGVRVGVLGVLTENALHAALPSRTVGFEVTDIVAALDRFVPELRPQVDVLILLAHVGCEREPELGERMKAWFASFPKPPLDLVVDGHSHQDLDSSLAKLVPVVQADHFGTRLGEVLLELGPKKTPTGRLFTRRIVLDSRKFPPPLRLLGRFASEQLAREKLEEEPLARVEEGLILPALPRADPHLNSPVGDLIAAAFLETARGELGFPETTLGVMNQGGVRMGLYAMGTKITRAALHSVMPFGNTMAIMSVPGDTLRSFLERGLQHRYRMSFRGVDLKVRQLAGERAGVPGPRELVDVMVVGPDGAHHPLEPARMYQVVTSEFLAAQGFQGDPRVTRHDFALTDFETVRKFLVRWTEREGALTHETVARRLPPVVHFVK